MEMKNFVWSDPVELVNVSMDNQYVKLHLPGGASVKMSIRKYGRPNAAAVYAKAGGLRGKKISYRTSQNTKDWSAGVWFSEIKEVV